MSKNSTEPWACAESGTIVKINRWSDTQVWSSGGGGYVDPNFGGHIKAAQVHSEVSQRCEVFLKCDSGQEKSMDLAYTGIEFREGSRVCLIWGSAVGAETGQYYYVENLDTGKTWNRAFSLDFRGNFFKWLYLSVVVFGCLSAGLYGAGVAPWSSSPDPARIAAAVAESIANCPPGKLLKDAEIKMQDSVLKDYRMDRRGSYVCATTIGKNKKPVQSCKCSSVEEATESISNAITMTMKNQSFENTLSSEPNAFLYLFLSGVLSFTLGSMWQRVLVYKRKRNELAVRKGFIEKLLESAKTAGHNFVIESIATMKLRRINK